MGTIGHGEGGDGLARPTTSRRYRPGLPRRVGEGRWRRRARRVVLVLVLAVGALVARWAPAAATVGGITLFHVPGSCICQGIATGADGALWFTEFYANIVGRMTTTGHVATARFPVNPNIAAYIAAGPDGALWVTLLDEIGGHGKIGRITTSGVETIYAVPGTSYLNDIIAGPDGALWITDKLGKVDRITTTGQVTEFPVHGPLNAYPYHIAAGPDGNLWFTEYNSSLIGTLTTAGQLTFHRIPAGIGSPDAIAAGPDGALWFTTDGDGARIGRMTTAGAVTTYPLSPTTDYVYPAGMTAGTDGNLWFTSLDATTGSGAVGRVTTSGQITEFPVPLRGSSPQAITVGPDGALWFADSSGYIGRVSPS